jgi:hypothetical protein
MLLPSAKLVASEGCCGHSPTSRVPPTVNQPSSTIWPPVRSRPIAPPHEFEFVDQMPDRCAKHATALSVRRRAPARHLFKVASPEVPRVPGRGRGRLRGPKRLKPRYLRAKLQIGPPGAPWSKCPIGAQNQGSKIASIPRSPQLQGTPIFSR